MRFKMPFLSLIGCLICASAAGESPSGPPVASMPETLYEAGNIIRGTLIEKTFPIKNAGGEVLRISNVESSCNCGAADYTPTIKPGEEGSVSIRIETDDLSGPIEKNLVAFTNDPSARQILFKIKAVVEDVILVKPSRTVLLGELPREERSLRKFLLRSEDGSPLKITSVDVVEGCVQPEVGVEDDGLTATLTFAIPPHYEIPNGSDVIHLKFAVHTSNPRLPLLVLKAAGEVKDSLRKAPAIVKFGTVGRKLLDGDPTDERLWTTLTIVYIGSEPLRVESVSANPDFLEAKLETNLDFGNRTIRLHLTPRAPSGKISGWVKAKTNLGDLFWPVTGTIP